MIAEACRSWFDPGVGVAALWVRAHLRRSWRRHLGLALLVGLIGAVGLTCVAGARRTIGAPDRFATDQRLPDVEVQVDDDALYARLARLPGTEVAGRFLPFFASPDRKDTIPGLDFITFAPADDRYSRDIDRPLVEEGRMPSPHRDDEVVASVRTARRLHLHVGDRVPMRSIPTDQMEALSSGSTDIQIDGPTPTVRIVGIVRSGLDVVGASFAPNYFLAGRAFTDRHRTAIGYWGQVMDVRLEPDTSFRAYTARVRAAAGPKSGIDTNDVSESLQGVRDATRVQGIALLLVGLAASIGGVVVITQAVGRSTAADIDDRRRLVEVGATPREIVRITLLDTLPAAAAGTGLAVAAAWLASSRFPVGIGRDIETQPGRQVDLLVWLLGATALLVMVEVRAAIGARRLDRVTQLDDHQVLPLVGRLSASTPATTVGARWAMRGPRGVAARASLLGVILAVTLLAAACTYRAGLLHLTRTPRAYGLTFDEDAGGGDDPREVAASQRQLLQNRAVGSVTRLRIVGTIRLDGKDLPGYAFTQVRGHIGPALVAGRRPLTDREIVLGSATARSLDVGIGDRVRATTKGGIRRLEVVGLGLFPTTETDRFARGALMTTNGLEAIALSEGYQELVFDWKAGVDVQRERARLRKAGLITGSAARPPDIENLYVIRSYPLILGGFFGLLAVVALGHVLVASTARRRREVGILRAIGFTQGQVVTASLVQAAFLVGAGIVVGLPLGVALGRLLWRFHASRIGVAVAQAEPFGLLVLVSTGIAVLTAALAGAVALRAAGHRTAVVLRAD